MASVRVVRIYLYIEEVSRVSEERGSDERINNSEKRQYEAARGRISALILGLVPHNYVIVWM